MMKKMTEVVSAVAEYANKCWTLIHTNEETEKDLKKWRNNVLFKQKIKGFFAAIWVRKA